MYRFEIVKSKLLKVHGDIKTKLNPPISFKNICFICWQVYKLEYTVVNMQCGSGGCQLGSFTFGDWLRSFDLDWLLLGRLKWLRCLRVSLLLFLSSSRLAWSCSHTNGRSSTGGQAHLCKCLSGLCITFAYWPRQVTWPSRGVGIMPHPTKGTQGVKSGGQ